MKLLQHVETNLQRQAILDAWHREAFARMFSPPPVENPDEDLIAEYSGAIYRP